MTSRNNDTLFVRTLINNINVGINVAQLGRIVKINGTQADVQPLAHNFADDSKRGLLLSVYMTRTVREAKTAPKVGDAVIVLFLDRSLENWTGDGGDFKLDSGRMHDVNDAVIVGCF